MVRRPGWTNHRPSMHQPRARGLQHSPGSMPATLMPTPNLHPATLDGARRVHMFMHRASLHTPASHLAASQPTLTPSHPSYVAVSSQCTEAWPGALGAGMLDEARCANTAKVNTRIQAMHARVSPRLLPSDHRAEKHLVVPLVQHLCMNIRVMSCRSSAPLATHAYA